MKKLSYFLLSLAWVSVMNGCSDDEPAYYPVGFSQNEDVSGSAGDQVILYLTNAVYTTDVYSVVINGKTMKGISQSSENDNVTKVWYEIPLKAGSGTIQIMLEDGTTIDGPKLTYIPRYYTIGMTTRADLGFSLAQYNTGAIVWGWENKTLYTMTTEGLAFNADNKVEVPVTYTKQVLNMPDASNVTGSYSIMTGMSVTDDNNIIFGNAYRIDNNNSSYQINLAIPSALSHVTYATGGVATTDLVSYPISIATDHEGENIYFAEYQMPYIRKYGSFGSGKVGTVAGSANAGHADGQGAAAQFQNITSIAYDKTANQLYVADQHCIRVVTPTGAVTTLAGSTSSGDQDGGVASARFNSIQAITLADNGKLYISDNGNGKVKVIDKDQTTVTTLVGVTSYASDKATQISVDQNGVIYKLSTGSNFANYFGVSLPESMVGEKEFEQMLKQDEGQSGGATFVVLKEN